MEQMDWKFRLRLEELAKERRQKSSARRDVTNAIKNGTLVKEPCRCGSKKVEAHHMDYSRPLEVIWACKKHHAELDKMKRELDSFEFITDPVIPIIP